MSRVLPSRASLFPGGVRQHMQTQAAGVTEVRVTTADELYSALERAPYGDVGSLSCYGRAIVLANDADMVMPAPIRLWAKHSGLTITSVSRGRILPGTSMDGEAMFEMGGGSTSAAEGAASDVTVNDLDIGAVGARAFSSVFYFERVFARAHITGLRWTANALAGTNGSGGISDGELSRCQRVHSASVTAANGISLSAQRVFIGFNQGAIGSATAVSLNNSIGNQIIGNSQLEVITLSGTSAGNIIALNGAQGVDTSTSLGSNVIVGNPGTLGSIASHVDDAVGLNT